MNFTLFRRHAVKAAAGLFLLSGILFVNPAFLETEGCEHREEDAGRSRRGETAIW